MWEFQKFSLKLGYVRCIVEWKETCETTDSDEVCGNVLVNGKFRDKTKKTNPIFSKG